MGQAAPLVISLIGAAGAAYAAYGQYRAGQYQKAVAKQNASLAEQAAIDAENRGRVEEAQHRMRVRSLTGTQRAEFGSSGVLLETGSPLDVIADTSMVGELDALTIRRNARLEAWGIRAQAGNFLAEGRLAKLQGNYGAGATLLQGASSAGGQFYGMQGGWYLGKGPGKG